MMMIHTQHLLLSSQKKDDRRGGWGTHEKSTLMGFEYPEVARSSKGSKWYQEEQKKLSPAKENPITDFVVSSRSTVRH
jgi:hypothetical protein